MTDPKGEPKEVGIGGQDVERSLELLAQLLLATGSRQRFPPARRQLLAQLVEQIVCERLEQVVAASEMLVEGCARDACPLRHRAGGHAGLVTRQDQLPGGVDQALARALLGLTAGEWRAHQRARPNSLLAIPIRR